MTRLTTGIATPARGALRALRGAVLAGSCLVVSIGAHVVAGGQLRMGWFDLLLALLLCTGCVAGADRRHGFWSLFTVVGVSQLVLHFTAGGHQGMVDGPGISLGMVLSHLLAALFISTILTLGERGLWVLLAVLRGPLSRLPVMADLTLSWVRRPTPTVVARPARTLQALVDVLDRRGPPVAVAS